MWGGTEHATFVILSLRCDRFSSFHSQIPCRPRGKRQPTWPLRAKSGTQLLSLGWSSSRRKRTWRRSSCRQHRSLPQRPPPRRPPPLARVTPRPRGATLRSSICRSPALLLHPQLPLRPSPLRPSPLRPSPIHPSPIHPSPIRPSPIRPSPIRQPAALLLHPQPPLRLSPLRRVGRPTHLGTGSPRAVRQGSASMAQRPSGTTMWGAGAAPAAACTM